MLLDSLLTGTAGNLKSVALQLTFLFGGGGISNTPFPTQIVYQTILLVVCSLALIWIFRQKQAKAAVSDQTSSLPGNVPTHPLILWLRL